MDERELERGAESIAELIAQGLATFAEIGKRVEDAERYAHGPEGAIVGAPAVEDVY